MVSFSASGRLGRMALPIKRWMKRKNAPTTVKTIKKKTSVATGSLGVGIMGDLSVENGLFDLLPPREAAVELVPVGDFRLIEPPAQVHFLAVLQMAKIDKAAEVIL